ncbi:hypothetical protein P154DRAFT_580879 [Amniculicola lignicola CBS 123094]|uniref:Uncharacterized protein n=1 Tax=Amniculicola lignicola CBS 123094 TaxID=1392246 RepID=A0A6A5W0Z1_9PLEO|nr:hypothetical protein P154DRAFT_580879 [Amniculicola lignicola CBS 123094]
MPFKDRSLAKSLLETQQQREEGHIRYSIENARLQEFQQQIDSGYGIPIDHPRPAFTGVAKSSYQQLIDDMHDTFSQELVDRVCEFVLVEDGKPTSKHVDLSARKPGTIPFYFRPRFVGDRLARELVHVYYTRFCFAMDLTGPLGIQHFLTFDYFNVGLVPSDWIRKLVITIPLDEVLSLDENTSGDRLWATFKGQLDALHTLKSTRKSVCFDFFLQGHLESPSAQGIYHEACTVRSNFQYTKGFLSMASSRV